MPSYTRSIWKIQSATPEWYLDAWSYLPEKRNGPLPVIVMAHGFAANKLIGLGVYAEAFAEAGYAAVVFDYMRWGASDGQPRHVLRVSDQHEDYRTVIRYCKKQPEFDPHRVILWGTSFSGGHAVTLASEPELDIRATIAQGPYLGVAGPEVFALTRGLLASSLYALVDLAKQAFGLKPIYIPAMAPSGEVGALTTPGTQEGMFRIVQNLSDFPNEVNAASILEIPFYKPYTTASGITCPVLVICLDQDNLCHVQGALEVEKRAPKAELVRLPYEHFDAYPGMPAHEASLSAMLAFLEKHVPA